MSDANITHRGYVRPEECDHMGHLNVTYYVKKFDDATWSLFTDLGMTSAYFRDNSRVMSAVQQNLTYKRELLPGDTVIIRTYVEAMETRKLTFRHEMELAASGEIAAVCHMLTVHVDASIRKACPFPDDIRARGEQMAGDTP